MLIPGKKYVLTAYAGTSFAEKPEIVEYVRPYPYGIDEVVIKKANGAEVAVNRSWITFVKES